MKARKYFISGPAFGMIRTLVENNQNADNDDQNTGDIDQTLVKMIRTVLWNDQSTDDNDQNR